jgi:hypothetical protein
LQRVLIFRNLKNGRQNALRDYGTIRKKPCRAAIISAEMTPDEAGRFSKTIDIHCNVAESPLKLTLTGTAGIE